MKLLATSCKFALLVLAVALAGCDKPAAPTPPPAAAPVVETPPVKAPAAVADQPPAKLPAAVVDQPPAKPAVDVEPIDVSAVALKPDEIANIKKLKAEADQLLALHQKVCPSSGEALGSMDVPLKVMLKDQPVFLCCGSCRKRALANPDKMLAKLGRK